MNPSGHETGGNDRPDHASKYVEEKSEEVADWSERRYRERRDWDSPFPLHEVGQDSLAPIPFESQVVRVRSTVYLGYWSNGNKCRAERKADHQAVKAQGIVSSKAVPELIYRFTKAYLTLYLPLGFRKGNATR